MMDALQLWTEVVTATIDANSDVPLSFQISAMVAQLQSMTSFTGETCEFLSLDYRQYIGVFSAGR